MEPFTTAALATALTTLVNGAAGEAGKTAWTSLRTFVKSRLGRDPQPAAAVAALETTPSDPAAAQQLAVTLHDLARDDHTAAAWLGAWLADVRAQTPVTNVIAGPAQISGNVVQTHTVNGDIHF